MLGAAGPSLTFNDGIVRTIAGNMRFDSGKEERVVRFSTAFAIEAQATLFDDCWSSDTAAYSLAIDSSHPNS